MRSIADVVIARVCNNGAGTAHREPYQPVNIRTFR
jgi:hypothetical protein